MPFDQRGLDSYVDVAQRIADFREQYPHGCLQPLDPAQPYEIREVTGLGRDAKPYTLTLVVYAAAAYRTPDDPRPGIGMAWEPFPGRTPYTLGSELMNAETSAWGRAIIAVLASDSKRGIASREEVRNRQAERDDEQPSPRRQREKPPPRPLEKLPRNLDGSVARSQTTDEELTATGQMTAAELRAHNKAVKETRSSPKLADRLTTTPADDLWYTPDGAEKPADATEPSPQGAATRDRLQAVVKALEPAGVTGRAEVRAVVESIVLPSRGGEKIPEGQELGLTNDEVDFVLSVIEDAEGLQALLTEMKAATADDTRS